MTIRLDRDIVDWLKKNGSGYQTCINPAQAARLNTVQFGGADHRLSLSAAFASAGSDINRSSGPPKRHQVNSIAARPAIPRNGT
jgi:hypothetical protein